MNDNLNGVLQDEADYFGSIIQDLQEQNKCYREALEKLVNAPQDMTRGRYADYADRVAREALEEIK